MKITKQLIERFHKPDDISVKIFNGYFKKAVAKVVYSNGWEYKVEVDTTPERLKRFGDFNGSSFLYPTSRNSWNVHKVPKELAFVEYNLRKLSKYTEEEIDIVEKRMVGGLNQLKNEMGFFNDL